VAGRYQLQLLPEWGNRASPEDSHGGPDCLDTVHQGQTCLEGSRSWRSARTQSTSGDPLDSRAFPKVRRQLCNVLLYYNLRYLNLRGAGRRTGATWFRGSSQRSFPYRLFAFKCVLLQGLNCAAIEVTRPNSFVTCRWLHLNLALGHVGLWVAQLAFDTHAPLRYLVTVSGVNSSRAEADCLRSGNTGQSRNRAAASRDSSRLDYGMVARFQSFGLNKNPSLTYMSSTTFLCSRTHGDTHTLGEI
jgi:hypothetical protein